jgi:hypothetical protein
MMRRLILLLEHPIFISDHILNNCLLDRTCFSAPICDESLIYGDGLKGDF